MRRRLRSAVSCVLAVSVIGLPIAPTAEAAGSVVPRGLAVALQEPGGFGRTLTYDPYGALTAEEGVYGSTAAAREREYDIAGRLQAVNSPAGAIQFSYDDRGLLTSTTGGSSTAVVTYDADGFPLTRADINGTSVFEWDTRGLLAGVDDPVSAQSLTYSYDDAGQIDTIAAPSGASYTYEWDNLGRLSEERVTAPTVGTTASRSYSYDLNGNLLEQHITAAGNPQAGLHTYAYDWADRLVEWDSPTSGPVTYGWDNAGNRTSVGAVTFTFDARNRLESSSAGLSNTFNARGDLVQTGTTTYGFDPLGRLTSAAGRTLTYDGLDRVVTLDGVAISYAGAASDPSVVGGWAFGRGPGTTVLSADDGTTASLVFPDRHGDASLMIDPVSGGIVGSQVFDPFGQVAGAAGVSSPLGFQSDVTDAVTGDMWMGARWMSPSLGVFSSRDTYAGTVATPATLNRYAYANGNPLSNWDPTGHSAESVHAERSGQAVTDQRELQRKIDERIAKGDVALAEGRPLLGGPMELISAFKAPDRSMWSTVKTVVTFTVAAVAGLACGPVFGGACAGVAGRFTSALLDGASASELFDVVTDWKSLLRDGMIGLVSLGAGATMGRLFNGAAVAVVRFVGAVVGGVVAGGAGDFTATLLAGGSISEGWDAATDLRRRAIDAGISVAAGLARTGARSSSKTTADEPGQPGNRPPKPKGPEADTTPPGEGTTTQGAAPNSCRVNSFVPSTLVLMADGTAKPIEDIEVGDLVRATDPETGEQGPRQVTDVIVGDGLKELVDVEIDGEVITATGGHPFWVDDQGRWVDAKDLEPGDALLLADGNTVDVASVRERTEVRRVHNLTVDGIHTYHVIASDAPVLVHNCRQTGSATEAATPGETLFHYTDEAGQNGILDSGQLNPSLKSVNPADARYGNGQYLSDVQPGSMSCAQLSRCFLGQPFQGSRFTNYVEIDVTGLDIIKGRPGVFVNPSETPLDLTGRVVSWGRN